MNATADRDARRFTVRRKLITCILPRGRGQPLMQFLVQDRGLDAVDIHHARGSGRITPLAHRGVGETSEKDILSVAVPAHRADEIFEYIYFEGGIGDIEGPSGSDTNQAWGVRSGVTVDLSSTVSSWLDGSFTHVENHSGSDEYDFWAIVGGAAWTPNDNLTMGPEVGFNRIDGDDAGEDGSVWGVMWRVERDF